MGIDDVIIASRQVPISGAKEPFVVHGLGLPAIVFLVRNHGAELQSLYERAAAGEIDVSDGAKIAVSLAEQSVELAAQIMACGVGEPDKWQGYLKLNIGDQVALLEAVFELTFAVEGGAKKVVETVVKAMQGVTETLDSLHD